MLTYSEEILAKLNKAYHKCYSVDRTDKKALNELRLDIGANISRIIVEFYDTNNLYDLCRLHWLNEFGDLQFTEPGKLKELILAEGTYKQQNEVLKIMSVYAV